MKIILLVTGLNVGGAEQQVVILAQRFKERQHSVKVVTLIEPGRLSEDLFKAGIEVESLHMKRGVPGLNAVWKLAQIVRRERPDVVHAHMFHANILARASRVFWRRVPLVCTIHNVNEASSRSTKWNEKTWRDDAYRWTNRMSSATTAICDTSVKRFVDSRIFQTGKISCVVNGIDIPRFSRNEESGARLRKELGLENKIVGLMVARMEPPKDQALLLRAWAEAVKKDSRLHLVLVGDGPARNDLEKLATELGVTANVSFMGIRKDVNAFMSMADFFLLITIMEGLPISLLEASAAGLPIIASDAGGNRDAVLHKHTGFLVVPGKAAELAQTITHMACISAEERVAMGKAARDLIVSRFNIDDVVNRWLELYCVLLKKDIPK